MHDPIILVESDTDLKPHIRIIKTPINNSDAFRYEAYVDEVCRQQSENPEDMIRYLGHILASKMHRLNKLNQKDVEDYCTCNSTEGCTNQCDRSTNRFFSIIEEARSLSPSSRDAVLNWILDRAASIAKIGQNKTKNEKISTVVSDPIYQYTGDLPPEIIRNLGKKV